MIELDPRGIAVQGVGFAPLLLGLQGLVPTSEQPVEYEPAPRLPSRRKKVERRDRDDDVLLFLLK